MLLLDTISPKDLILSILVAPIGIGLLKVAISDVKPFTATVCTQANSAIQVLLVFVCACLWVGLSGSLQESHVQLTKSSSKCFPNIVF
jgi:hypothetical protein